MKHWISTQPKGIEEYLKELCKIYRGEEDNPHNVDALIDDERAIQFLKYHLWDVERSIMENPGHWRFLVIEHNGSLPSDDESIAQKIYDYAVKMKLEKLAEIGIDLTGIYKRLSW